MIRYHSISPKAFSLSRSPGKLFLSISLTGLCILMFPLGKLAAQDRNLLQKTVPSGQLESLLILNQKWVSYPGYTDRTGWDKLTGSLKQTFIDAGEKTLDYQWQYIPLSAYLEFERSGQRQMHETPNNTNTYALNNLVLAELAEGKGRFLDQIINGVWYFCDMSSWANPNGLLATSATRPSRPFPNPEEQVIDLVTGDMSSLLAWTYYFLKEPMDKVHPGISARLRHRLRQRILDPYMQRDDFWWQALNPAKKFVNNWNPWCNFNVLSCYLLLEDDPRKLAAAVQKTMRSVDKYINYNHEDGACEEGPFYWDLGAGKLYEYLTLLHRATGGKISLFDQPLFKNMGEYIVNSYIGDGWVVNFADATARSTGPPGLIYRYGKSVNSGPMMQFGAYLAERSRHNEYVNCRCHSSGRDIFRTLENISTFEEISNHTSALPRKTYSWYPQTEFCYMRSGHFFLAAKGGHNGESHNHNDVGSLIVFYKNKPLLVDAGVGTYTRQTFSKDRYEIWTMLSDYHNLPVINGVTQKNGRTFRSKDARFDPQTMTFSLDIAEAYEASGADYWRRSFTLNPDNRGVSIREDFKLNEIRDVNRINFITPERPDVSKTGVVSFSIEGDILQLLYDARRFSAETEQVMLPDPRLSNVWGPALYRLRFKALKQEEKSSYLFSLRVEQ